MTQELDDIMFMLNKPTPNIRSINLMIEAFRIYHKV